MRTELPICRRCCFCLPLRYGLIVWGYLKLIISGLLLTGVTMFLIRLVRIALEEQRVITTSNIIFTCVVFIVGIIDIIFNILFLIGCHKKIVKFLITYYYYSMVVMVLTVALGLYSMGLTIEYMIDYSHTVSIDMFTIIYDIMDSMLFIANLALQFYIILLIRSQFIKIKESCQFRFVNNATEAQCTLKIAENIDSEKETACGRRDEDEDDIHVYV